MDNKELTWQEFASLFTALRIGSYVVKEEDSAINEINQPEGTSDKQGETDE